MKKKMRCRECGKIKDYNKSQIFHVEGECYGIFEERINDLKLKIFDNSLKSSIKEFCNAIQRAKKALSKVYLDDH